MIATIDSDAYKLFFSLHILAVVVGFGTLSLAGVFGVKAKARGGREGLAVAEVLFDVTRHWAEWFIYAVPVLGIILILLSDDFYKFSEAWVSLSFLLYIAAIAVLHAVHLPNLRRMNALAAELVAGGAASGSGPGGPPPQVAELEARGRRAAMVGGAVNLAWVVVLFLMVWKPGH